MRSFVCRARAQCLDYARNNVWNAIILEAVAGNEQFLNLQVAYPKSGTELCFVVTLCYTAESHVPAMQVWRAAAVCLFAPLCPVNQRWHKFVEIADIMSKSTSI